VDELDSSMISVVIVTFNSAACIGTCVDAVGHWLPGAERMVIDNASIDATRAVAEDHGARVVELHENIGFGRACNVGAEHAERAHLLFLNPDVEIRSSHAGQLAGLLEAADLGLVVPSSTAGRFAFGERPLSRDALSLTLGTLRPRELPQPQPAPRSGQELWASGAALLVRRSEFLGLGGFDHRYFMYYEDRELSWRYRRAGLSVRVTPALLAEHVGGGSSELGDRRPDIIAFAIMGWLQYTYAIRGPRAAARAWRLLRGVHGAIMRAVTIASRIIPSQRLSRKSLQLREVTQELTSIRACSGVLARSDGSSYWTEAVALMNGSSSTQATR
jgi:N-acetylglucosaminyl-diphospho-decaprenol L-rhamnosyltransferase